MPLCELAHSNRGYARGTSVVTLPKPSSTKHQPMRCSILLPLLLVACDGPTATVDHRPNFDAPLDVDGVHLFIPVKWNRIYPSDPRPWPNGLRIDTGGWGQEQPWLGPLAAAEPLPAGQFFWSDSTAQPLPNNHVDPFLRLTFTFEFPLRPREDSWTRSDPGWGYPFSYDQLEMTYRSAVEDKAQPYTALLAGLRPSDGADVGDGWREVRRVYDKRPILLRFDTQDWRIGSDTLPRRLAASFTPAAWSHFTTLSQPRWTASFESTRLPIAKWRARYETADQLFAWLRTPPERRNPARRFTWWTKGQYRPAR